MGDGFILLKISEWKMLKGGGLNKLNGGPKT
jgi:hypothetical protein